MPYKDPEKQRVAQRRHAKTEKRRAQIRAYKKTHFAKPEKYVSMLESESRRKQIRKRGLDPSKPGYGEALAQMIYNPRPATQAIAEIVRLKGLRTGSEPPDDPRSS